MTTGPISVNPRPLTGDEHAVLEVLLQGLGAGAALAIDEIRERTGLSYRGVTRAVESLRVNHHLPIGSSRVEPHGYFIIQTAVDLESTVRPLRNQALSMLRVVVALQGRRKRRLRELLGQLEIELGSDGVVPARIEARVRGQDAVIETAHAETCWHCFGEKVCECVFCAVSTPQMRWLPGECGACKGTGFLCWPEKVQ